MAVWLHILVESSDACVPETQRRNYWIVPREKSGLGQSTARQKERSRARRKREGEQEAKKMGIEARKGRKGREGEEKREQKRKGGREADSKGGEKERRKEVERENGRSSIHSISVTLSKAQAGCHPIKTIHFDPNSHVRN